MNQAPRSIIEEIIGLKKYREFVRTQLLDTSGKFLLLEYIENEMHLLKIRLNSLYSARPIPIPEGMTLKELVAEVHDKDMSISDILLGPPHMQADVPNKPTPQDILRRAVALEAADLLVNKLRAHQVNGNTDSVAAGIPMPRSHPAMMRKTIFSTDDVKAAVSESKAEAPKQPQTVSTTCLKLNLPPPEALPEMPPSSRLVR